MKIDLHMHTTASDGTDTPSEVVRLAFRQGFETIAVTDHDSMEGVEEARREGAKCGLAVIPGVEISAMGEKEVHVLGYGMESTGEFEEMLSHMRRQRDERMIRMVKKLNAMGVSITLEQAVQDATGAVGRAHLARALVRRGSARDIRDAFNRFLAPGRPAYVPREKLSVEDAIRMIRSVGGVPVIAHPGQERSEGYWSIERLRPWVQAGLLGLECYHPSHSQQQCDELLGLCRRLGLLVTGGSDYHGKVKQVRLGEALERWTTRDEDFARFIRTVKRGTI